MSCKLLEEVPFVKFQTTEANNCTTHLSGKYNFENIAAALCIGKYFNIPSNAANTAVCDYDPVNNRSQILKTTTNTLYLDAYNANPSSMKVALENFERLNAENKVVILGDMFELGDESKQEHIALGKLLGELNFNKILLCGKEIAAAKEFIKTANHFSDRNSLESWLSQNKLENNTIFIKGSRGMGLENLIKLL